MCVIAGHPTIECPGMATVTRLVGVYDADGTVRGELAYWIGARLGRAHCALCDITHGSVRPRPDWYAARARLPVPFPTVHRDEMPPGVAELGADLPFVAVETDEGARLLLDRRRLESLRPVFHRLRL